MENVLLVILLILALSLIAVVLMQRSEGGGLGIGGGGGVMSARGAATALGKVTWGLGIAFLAISLAMTIVSARNAADSSVIDRVGGTQVPVPETPAAPVTPPAANVTDMMPPASAGDVPLAPPPVE